MSKIKRHFKGGTLEPNLGEDYFWAILCGYGKHTKGGKGKLKKIVLEHIKNEYKNEFYFDNTNGIVYVKFPAVA